VISRRACACHLSPTHNSRQSQPSHPPPQKVSVGASRIGFPSVALSRLRDSRPDTIARWATRHIKTPNLDRLVKRGLSWIAYLGRAIDSNHECVAGNPQGALPDGRVRRGHREDRAVPEARLRVGHVSRKTIRPRGFRVLLCEGDLSPGSDKRHSSLWGPRGSELDAT